jgi:hypothetical protein
LRKWPSTDYLLHSRKRANEIQEMDPGSRMILLVFHFILAKRMTTKDS